MQPIINRASSKAFLLAASSLMIAIAPAKADWQFTKWGMTPEQVQKASPVKLSSGDYCPVNNKTNGRGFYDVKYASDWNVGSMKFIACFLFARNKLSIVNLFSQNANQDAVIRGLSQRYGSPKINTNLQEIGIISYKWDLPNEKIEFSVSSSKDTKNPYVLSYESKSGSDENMVRDGL